LHIVVAVVVAVHVYLEFNNENKRFKNIFFLLLKSRDDSSCSNE